jgi:UDP-glucose 4-epimerase
LRYFNAAGADKSLRIGLNKPAYTHLIPLAVRAALGQDDALKIYGADWPTPDGSCIRDYIHIEDLSRAHLLAAEYLRENDESLILNLGTEKGSSVLEVVKAVERHRPCPHSVTARRPGDSAALVADATQAHRILGWRAKATLDDIVLSDLKYRLKLQQDIGNS